MCTDVNGLQSSSCGSLFWDQCEIIVTLLQQELIPDLHVHFQSQSFHTSMYASSWFLTLFTTVLPLPVACRIMDVFLSEGMEVIFKVALALLTLGKEDLLCLDMEGMLKVRFKIGRLQVHLCHGRNHINRRFCIAVLPERSSSTCWSRSWWTYAVGLQHEVEPEAYEEAWKGLHSDENKRTRGDGGAQGMLILCVKRILKFFGQNWFAGVADIWYLGMMLINKINSVLDLGNTFCHSCHRTFCLAICYLKI